MDTYKYAFILVDRLEHYTTKEIEKSIYGFGEGKYVAYHQRMTECMEARKELDYHPIPKDIREFLWNYGYDGTFINRFESEYEKNLIGYNRILDDMK